MPVTSLSVCWLWSLIRNAGHIQLWSINSLPERWVCPFVSTREGHWILCAVPYGITFRCPRGHTYTHLLFNSAEQKCHYRQDCTKAVIYMHRLDKKGDTIYSLFKLAFVQNEQIHIFAAKNELSKEVKCSYLSANQFFKSVFLMKTPSWLVQLPNKSRGSSYLSQVSP